MGKDTNSFKRGLLWGTAAATLFAFDAGVAVAQEASVTSAEIVVTARRRAESLQSVPVVVTAIDAATLERSAVNGFEDIAQLTPGLNLYGSGNTANQGAISLRGIQTGSTNLASDQAVALNIDGVQIDSALGLKSGMFDLRQVEVLKGPQALYFGKNNSGGVISVATADPTDGLFVQGRAGYEFGARERYGEFILSGPLTATLGGRAAVYYSEMDGWLSNLSDTAPTQRVPSAQEMIARGTLLWEPNDDFSARLKLTYSSRNADQHGWGQKAGCFRPGQTTAECELDDNISQSAPVDVLGRYDHDDPFSDARLYVAALALNYEITDSLSLAATTGFYDFEQKFFDSLLPRASTDVLGGNPNEILGQATDEMKSISQELRLSSDFNGPLNFMLGAFFDDREIQSDVILQFGATANPRNLQRVESTSYSVFGQVSYDILSDLELSGGVRYTHEEREYTGVLLEALGPFAVGTPLVPLDDELRENNISPEVSLTWRPSSALTLFAAYKEGFKSGSFDISSTGNLGLLAAPGTRDIRFNSEYAEGYEVGFKTLWFDGQLRFNGAIYTYDYTDLQLASFDPNSATTRVLNAAGATTEGAELDLRYAPDSFEGLVLNAALNYNKSRYTDFITDCHQGQLTTGTCPLDLRAPSPATESQDLSGTALRSAPDWTASAGFTLERSLNEGVDYRLGLNANYSSSYNSEEKQDPLGRQDSYVLINGNIGLTATHERWSLDLIGRNLTDELFMTTSNSQPLTGGGGFRQDYFVNTDRGREVRLQLTLRN